MDKAIFGGLMNKVLDILKVGKLSKTLNST